MAAYIRRRLQSAYHVLEAPNGDVALRLVAKEIPDLIVSDVLMPGMDGFDLCRALKADPKSSFIPVILLTARAALDDKVEGLDCGAEDYITKPFESKELLARIRNLLKACERQQQRLRTVASQVLLQSPPSQGLSSDEVLLRRMRQVLEKYTHDASFGVETLSQHLAMSRVHLHRKLAQICRATPSEIILNFRLERAAQMLTRREGNVGEVAFAVGFKDLSHFVRRFRQRYGKTPANYVAAPPPDALRE